MLKREPKMANTKDQEPKHYNTMWEGVPIVIVTNTPHRPVIARTPSTNPSLSASPVFSAAPSLSSTMTLAQFSPELCEIMPTMK